MAFHILIIFLLITSVYSVNSQIDILSQKFTTFNNIEDLYKLIYDAYQAKVFSDNGVFVESVGVDIIKGNSTFYFFPPGIPTLKDFFIANGILAADSIQYDAVRTYLDSNISLRNMLVHTNIIDSALNNNPEAIKDIFTRYNPNTGTLDPKVEDGRKLNTGIDFGNFVFESVSDVYETILKMYRYGLFDREGNFIETSFSSLLKSEPNLAYIKTNHSYRAIIKSNNLVDASLKIDYAQVHRFIQERAALYNLLSAAGVYRDGKYYPAAVSAAVFRYNKDTKQVFRQIA